MMIYDLGRMIAEFVNGAAELVRRASEGRPARDLKSQISNLKWGRVAVPALVNKQHQIALHPSLARRANGGRFNLRRGISLLEVLISMFIMMVGLLGVAALIPVGKFEVQRGAQADRASACGRAAMRDLKVRRMLDPLSWSTIDGYKVFWSAGDHFSVDNDTTPTPLRAFAIDPLAITDAASNGLRAFPFDSASSPPVDPLLPRIPRITLGPGLTPAQRLALADSVFRWQDDLSYDEPTGATTIPRQVMQGGAKRLSQGDYSWLATVVPDVASVQNSSNAFDVPVRVSVAVFFKRQLNAAGAGERACNVQLTGTGEVTLRVHSAASASNEGVDPQYAVAGAGSGPAHLEVKPGQWLMISGFQDIDGVAGTTNDRRWDQRWYRIVNADAVIDSTGTEVTPNNPGTGPWSRTVTIAGADWTVPTAIQAAFNADARAFLFDGIVAVYEQKMKLERDSIYGN